MPQSTQRCRPVWQGFIFASLNLRGQKRFAHVKGFTLERMFPGSSCVSLRMCNCLCNSASAHNHHRINCKAVTFSINNKNTRQPPHTHHPLTLSPISIQISIAQFYIKSPAQANWTLRLFIPTYALHSSKLFVFNWNSSGLSPVFFYCTLFSIFSSV